MAAANIRQMFCDPYRLLRVQNRKAGWTLPAAPQQAIRAAADVEHKVAVASATTMHTMRFNLHQVRICSAMRRVPKSQSSSTGKMDANQKKASDDRRRY
jgi:hypothetical protein